MSGKDTYEERRRLEAENALLYVRRENQRLKAEAETEDMAVLLMAAVRALLTGRGALVIQRNQLGMGDGYRVRFDIPGLPDPPSLEHLSDDMIAPGA